MIRNCLYKYESYQNTIKSLDAPDVTLSGPKINSSAARPPIALSIRANNLDFVV